LLYYLSDRKLQLESRKNMASASVNAIILDICDTDSAQTRFGLKLESIKAFSKNLRTLINERGYTHEDAAKALGVSRNTVTTWVSGRQGATLKQLDKIALHFGVTPSMLLSENMTDERMTEISPDQALNILAKALGKEVRNKRDRRKKTDENDD
jgi:transcriptional regulator with XRE-family HTH domain